MEKGIGFDVYMFSGQLDCAEFLKMIVERTAKFLIFFFCNAQIARVFGLSESLCVPSSFE